MINMKNIFFTLFLFAFLSIQSLSAVSLSTKYVLYYKVSEYSSWTRAQTYTDFNSCENARKYSYAWAYASTCNSE